MPIEERKKQELWKWKFFAGCNIVMFTMQVMCTYIFFEGRNYNMKKRILAMTCLLTMLMCGSTCFAKGITFQITKSEGVKQVTTNTKDLSGSVWKISNLNTSYSNFVEDKDVIGFKAKRASGASASAYHTFSKFVYRYSLPYTSTPAQGETLKLNTQIDSKGQYNSIKFDGEWIS